MAHSGSALSASDITKEFHKANYTNLVENLTPEKSEEIQLGAACFLLGIELKELIEVAGETSEKKTEARNKAINAKFKKTVLRWHPDKNLEARMEAEELTKLCNNARDVLKSFIERDCELALADQSSNAKFWQDYKASQEKYETQYVTDSDDPDYFIHMAGSPNEQYTFKQNWGVEDEQFFPPKEPEEETAVAIYEARLVPKLEVTGSREVTFFGPEAFFKLLTSFSLPRSFKQYHFFTAVSVKSEEQYNKMGQEGRERAYELIRKCLTTPAALDFIDTENMLHLARQATHKGIISIGKTDLEVFLYYLKHYPQTLYPRRIEKIIEHLTKVSKVDLEELKVVVDTLLEDPAILYGLSSDCLIQLVESCADEGVRIAAAILKDKVLASNLKDGSRQFSHTRKLVDMLTKNVLDDTLKVASKEILSGNSLWQAALTDEASRQVKTHLESFDLVKEFYPDRDEKEMAESAVSSQFVLLPEMHAIQQLSARKYKELSHFNSAFIYEKFKENHFQIFHPDLAEYFIIINEPEKAKEILQALIETYCSEEDKQAFKAQLSQEDINLEVICLKVKDKMVLHIDNMIERFIEHLKLQFREYIKNPESRNMLAGYREQFRLVGKKEVFDAILKQEKSSLKKALLPIVFKDEPVDIFDGIQLTKVDDVRFYEAKIRDYDPSIVTLVSHLEAFLCDEIKSFAGIAGYQHRDDTDVKAFLSENNIDIHDLEKIRVCFQRLRGEKGLQKFNEMMTEYLPGVANLANPKQEIIRNLTQRFQLAVQGEEKQLEMTDIKSQFQGIGLSEQFTKLHQAELRKIKDGLMANLDDLEASKKLLLQYQQIQLRDEGNSLLDLEIVNLAMIVEIQTFLKAEFGRHIPEIIPLFKPTNASQLPEEKLQEMKDYLYQLSNISQVKVLFTRSLGGIYAYHNKKSWGNNIEKYFSSKLFYVTDEPLSVNLKNIANQLQSPQLHLITERKRQTLSIDAHHLPALTLEKGIHSIREEFDENSIVEEKKELIRKTLQTAEENFREQSGLSARLNTVIGRFCFMFVRYSESVRSDLENQKKSFIEKLDELAGLYKTTDEKLAVYEQYINSPVIKTHRNSGLWAIRRTKSTMVIEKKIEVLKSSASSERLLKPKSKKG